MSIGPVSPPRDTGESPPLSIYENQMVASSLVDYLTRNILKINLLYDKTLVFVTVFIMFTRGSPVHTMAAVNISDIMLQQFLQGNGITN